MKSVFHHSAVPPLANAAVNWDAVGIAGSLVCLAHCLLLPMVLAALPLLALFEEEWLHRGLAVALLVPVALVLVPGWYRHGRWLPGLFMTVGLVAINTAVFTASERWETGLTLAGALSLILAHGLNLYFCRRCLRCADGGEWSVLASADSCPVRRLP